MADATETKIVIQLELSGKGDADALSNALDKVDNSSKGASSSIASLAARYVSYAAVAATAYKATQTIVGELITAQEATRKTRVIFGEMADEVIRRSDQMQKAMKNRFANEAFLDAMTQFNALLGDTAGGVDDLEKLTVASANFARVTGTDMASAVNAVVGALAGRGLELKRWGVRVDDASLAVKIFGEVNKDAWDKLSDADKTAIRMEQVLKGLEERFASVGTETETLTDKWAQFGTTVADVAENVGNSIEPMLSSMLDSATALVPVLEQLYKDALKFGMATPAVLGARVAKGLFGGEETGVRQVGPTITGKIADITAKPEGPASTDEAVAAALQQSRHEKERAFQKESAEAQELLMDSMFQADAERYLLNKEMTETIEEIYARGAAEREKAAEKLKRDEEDRIEAEREWQEQQIANEQMLMDSMFQADAEEYTLNKELMTFEMQWAEDKHAKEIAAIEAQYELRQQQEAELTEMLVTGWTQAFEIAQQIMDQDWAGLGGAVGGALFGAMGTAAGIPGLGVLGTFVGTQVGSAFMDDDVQEVYVVNVDEIRGEIDTTISRWASLFNGEIFDLLGLVQTTILPGAGGLGVAGVGSESVTGTRAPGAQFATQVTTQNQSDFLAFMSKFGTYFTDRMAEEIGIRVLAPSADTFQANMALQLAGPESELGTRTEQQRAFEGWVSFTLNQIDRLTEYTAGEFVGNLEKVQEGFEVLASDAENAEEAGRALIMEGAAGIVKFFEDIDESIQNLRDSNNDYQRSTRGVIASLRGTDAELADARQNYREYQNSLRRTSDGLEAIAYAEDAQGERLRILDLEIQQNTEALEEQAAAQRADREARIEAAQEESDALKSMWDVFKDSVESLIDAEDRLTEVRMARIEKELNLETKRYRFATEFGELNPEEQFSALGTEYDKMFTDFTVTTEDGLTKMSDVAGSSPAQNMERLMAMAGEMEASIDAAREQSLIGSDEAIRRLDEVQKIYEQLYDIQEQVAQEEVKRWTEDVLGSAFATLPLVGAKIEETFSDAPVEGLINTTGDFWSVWDQLSEDQRNQFSRLHSDSYALLGAMPDEEDLRNIREIANVQNEQLTQAAQGAGGFAGLSFTGGQSIADMVESGQITSTAQLMEIATQAYQQRTELLQTYIAERQAELVEIERKLGEDIASMTAMLKGEAAADLENFARVVGSKVQLDIEARQQLVEDLSVMLAATFGPGGLNWYNDMIRALQTNAPNIAANLEVR